MTTHTMKGFTCVDLGENLKFLESDFDVNCEDTPYESFRIFNGVVLVLFVFGWPIFLGVVMFVWRKEFLNGTEHIVTKLLSVGTNT